MSSNFVKLGINYIPNMYTRETPFFPLYAINMGEGAFIELYIYKKKR